MARDEDGRWAVENWNIDDDIRVRLLETSQEWVAKFFRDKANETLQPGHFSQVVRIDK